MAATTSTPRSTIKDHASMFMPRKHRAAARNGTCTHLTMTRLYTEDFRCVVCLQTSSTGWLWRCTQDRDLMLEEDAAFDEDKLDAISDLIPRSDVPRKRSPAARASRLSFLDEINEADLQTYTPAQLRQILSQRSHVLEVARRETEGLVADDASSSSGLSTNNTSSTYRRSSLPPQATPTRLSMKLWLPAADTECQFKCCHYCRPGLLDRSYLSLNEVASGGISPTAAAGFGFHLQKQRPVALVKHVKSLGLRPSPPQPPASPSYLDQHQNCAHKEESSGLPITITRLSRSYVDSTKCISSTPSSIKTEVGTSTTSLQIHDTRNPSAAAKFQLALFTPLPAQSPEELALISGPPTPMEESERVGMFGSAPLDLRRGVAVTEEAVGLHVPNLITQV